MVEIHATAVKGWLGHTNLEVHWERGLQGLIQLVPEDTKNTRWASRCLVVHRLLKSHRHGYQEIKQYVVQRTLSRA